MMKDKRYSIAGIIGVILLFVMVVVIIWTEAYVTIPLFIIAALGVMKEFSKKARLEAAIESLIPLIKDKGFLYVFEMPIGEYKFTYRPATNMLDSTRYRLIAKNGEYIYDNLEDGVNSYLDEDKLEPIIDLVKSKVAELEMEYEKRRKSINDMV